MLPVLPSMLHHCTRMSLFEPPLNFSLLKCSRSESNMTNLHAELRVTLTENGIPDASPLLEYMDWAGIRTKNSLAMFFTDTDKITEWIEKFQNEITFGTPEKKIHLPEDDRRKGLQACFIAAWHICRDDFNAARQSKLPATSLTPSPTPPTVPASTTDDKVPKAWPKGVYQQLLTDYRTSTGNTRSFRKDTHRRREDHRQDVARAYHLQKLSGCGPWRNHHQPHLHCHRLSQQHRQAGQVRQDPRPRHRTQHTCTPRTKRLGSPVNDDDP